MQTQLPMISVLSVATLLWTFPIHGTTQRENVPTAKQDSTHYVGVASWYGVQHQGRKMANGKRFDRRQLTAASWYFPLGTTVRVVNLENGKSEVVTITDRGPDRSLHRVIDLSEAAAEKLGYIRQGLTSVFLFPFVVIEPERTTTVSSLREPLSNDISVRSQILFPR
jgi:rare lipoprotein A